MEGLKDDTDTSAAQPGQGILAERAEIVSVDLHLSGTRPLQPAQHHHQGRFARAGGTDDAHRLAGIDLERDAAENVDGAGSAAQSQVNIFKYHERAAGMKRGGHIPSESGREARQAGWRDATRGRRKFRPYGAVTLVFNVMRSLAAAVTAPKGAGEA